MEGIQTPFAHSAPRGSLDVPSSAKDAFQGFAQGGTQGKRCECGKSRPTFAQPGEPASRCYNCRKEGDVVVT